MLQGTEALRFGIRTTKKKSKDNQTKIRRQPYLHQTSTERKYVDPI
jgi:hypothetical protein